MFKPLVIGSRMELVSKKSLRNNEERIVYASQILDFNDDSIVCAMPIYEGRIVPLEAGKRFDAYFYELRYSELTALQLTEAGITISIQLRYS